MEREIKFRVRDKSKREWYKPTYEAYKGKLEEVVMFPKGHVGLRKLHGRMDCTDDVINRFELYQYTGLKDKNGTEIYEGDILRRTKKTYPGYYAKKYVINDIFDRVHVLGKTNGTDMEIIGNIHQDPNLLNKN